MAAIVKFRREWYGGDAMSPPVSSPTEMRVDLCDDLCGISRLFAD